MNQQPSFWQVVKSVGASFVGVQSDKNYQSDFQQTSAVPYIIVGVVLVILFVITLVIAASYFTS